MVIWVGGGAALTILGLRAERATDGAEVTGIARQAAFLGERVFAPAGLVVVATGIGMVSNADLGYDHFWIAFGLLGFLSTFVIGVAVLVPEGEEARRTRRLERPGRARDAGGGVERSC